MCSVSAVITSFSGIICAFFVRQTGVCRFFLLYLIFAYNFHGNLCTVNRRFFSNLQFNLCVSLKPSTSQTSLYCNSEQCSRLRNVLNASNGNLGNIFLVARVKSTPCGAVRAFCKFQFFTLHFELSKKNKPKRNVQKNYLQVARCFSSENERQNIFRKSCSLQVKNGTLTKHDDFLQC